MKMPIKTFLWIMDDAYMKVFSEVGPDEAAEIKMVATNLLGLLKSKSDAPPMEIEIDLAQVLPELLVGLMSLRKPTTSGWR